MIGPADLLQLAERWIECRAEAEWRTAVSRASESMARTRTDEIAVTFR